MKGNKKMELIKVFENELIKIIQDNESEQLVIIYSNYGKQDKIKIINYGIFSLDSNYIILCIKELMKEETQEEYLETIEELKESDFFIQLLEFENNA